MKDSWAYALATFGPGPLGFGLWLLPKYRLLDAISTQTTDQSPKTKDQRPIMLNFRQRAS